MTRPNPSSYSYLLRLPFGISTSATGCVGWRVLHRAADGSASGGADAPGSHHPFGGDSSRVLPIRVRWVGESLDLARLLELARWLDPQISADAEHSTRVSRVALALADAAGLDRSARSRSPRSAVSCTTSARSPCRCRSSPSAGPLDELRVRPGQAPPGRQRRARDASADMGHLAGRSCATTTSAGTGSATPTGSPVRGSRSSRACSRSRTPTTRCWPTVPTARRSTRSRRATSSSSARARSSTRTSSSCSSGCARRSFAARVRF